jgi:hypothetical protein
MPSPFSHLWRQPDPLVVETQYPERTGAAPRLRPGEHLQPRGYHPPVDSLDEAEITNCLSGVCVLIGRSVGAISGRSRGSEAERS